MSDYTPFLKLKVNEVGAVSTLAPGIRSALVPFFDIPTKPALGEQRLAQIVARGAASIRRNLSEVPAFYLDNFDIDDDIVINGSDNYQFVIQTFQALPFIPVIGLDRRPARNAGVFARKLDGTIASADICIRLQPDDFASFDLIASDLEELWDAGSVFDRWTVILDNRFCLNVDVGVRAAEIAAFIQDYTRVRPDDRIIVTGSSIPPSIGGIAAVRSENVQQRTELQIFSAAGLDVALGDYTVVSPLYADLDIPPAALLNVMAPRVIYSFEDAHFIARGGAIRTDPRGNLQYNDIAQRIVSLPFYRGQTFSFGDQFLYDKSQGLGSQVTPGSILKPTINAHISYMVARYGLP